MHLYQGENSQITWISGTAYCKQNEDDMTDHSRTFWDDKPCILKVPDHAQLCIHHTKHSREQPEEATINIGKHLLISAREQRETTNEKLS